MSTWFHIDRRYLEHRNPEGHPERSARIENLLPLEGLLVEAGVEALASDRLATDEELLRVHTPAHLERIGETAGDVYNMLDPDTHTSPRSAETARHAAGALLDLVDAVVAGAPARGFAAVRPPGHHAEADRAMGFCLFNNVAVAAAHLVARHGMERVLIVDPDVHHGNGTQAIFYDDPRVLFVSLHQYPFYPGTGNLAETGEREGLGYTVNVPLPAGCTDGDYLAAFDRVVLPVAREFAPSFVLMSAGYDALGRDPLGGMRMTEAGFDAITAALRGIADAHSDGRFVSVLEGGYNTGALRDGVETTVRRMHAGGEADTGGFETTPAGTAALRAAVDAARAHWKLDG
jgi:acetoin utilization deacetylase AcuC-like enzyme